MFKNLLKIEIKDTEKVVMLQADTSWQEKDIFYVLLNRYIPSKVTEILPLENRTWLIKWKNQDRFLELIADADYNIILNKIAEYGITVIWTDSFDKEDPQ